MYLNRSVDILRRTGHPDTLLRSLLNLITLYLELGELEQAQQLFTELAMIPVGAKGAAELRQEQQLRGMLRSLPS